MNQKEKLQKYAKNMRKIPTPAEYNLRYYLKQNSEPKILRQHIVGNCIVDFGLPYRNLLIEVDGEIHDSKKDKDNKRDLWFKSLGFNILRFSNEEIINNIKDVLKRINKFRVSEDNRVKFYLSTRLSKIKKRV